MKKFLTVIFIFCAANLLAQNNRTQQAANITSNVYQNNTHNITGAILQSVMLNQNNSYVNLLSDTNLLDVRLFSSSATYTPGMGAFYGDTLWMNIATAHGTWTSADWLKIAYPSACVCSSLVKYSDTVAVVSTHSWVNQKLLNTQVISSASTFTLSAANRISILPTNHQITLDAAVLNNFPSNAAGSLTNDGSGNLSWSSSGVGLFANDTIGASSHIGTSTQIGTNYSTAILGGNNNPLSAFIIGPINGYAFEVQIGGVLSAYLDLGFGSSSTLFGYGAGTGQNYNTSFGYNAMHAASSSGVFYSDAFGYYSLYQTQARENSAFGSYTLTFNTTGIYNVAVSDSSLINNTTGSRNTAIGHLSGSTNVTGFGNTFVGDKSNTSITGGSNQTAVGDSATVGATQATSYGALSSATGINSTAIGYGAVTSIANQYKAGNASLLTFILGGGAFCLPIQRSTATSGTVSSNGAQVLRLTGSATAFTINPPTPVVDGQLWEISTNQTSITLSFGSGASFDVTPTSVTKSTPIKLYWDATNSVWANQ